MLVFWTSKDLTRESIPVIETSVKLSVLPARVAEFLDATAKNHEAPIVLPFSLNGVPVAATGRFVTLARGQSAMCDEAYSFNSSGCRSGSRSLNIKIHFHDQFPTTPHPLCSLFSFPGS